MAGAFRAEHVGMLKEADAIFLDELHASGWYEKVAQAFVVFLPVRSVGVVGDTRLRSCSSVESCDLHRFHDCRLG